MSYVTSVLRPEENVIAIGRVHWIIYARGIAVLVVALALLAFSSGGAVGTILKVIGILGIALAVYDLARAWIRQVTTEVAVTNRRIIKKRGLIWRETAEMNMDKVESALVEQSLLGRVLNYGSIVIRGTGSGIEGLDEIADPLALRSAILVH